MEKEEAKKYKKELKKHFKNIKDEDAIIKIYNLIDELRKSTDGFDVIVVNRLENIARKVHQKNYKKLCLIDLYDILDWNVKKYGPLTTRDIVSCFEKIMVIDDKAFWEKLIVVFRGS